MRRDNGQNKRFVERKVKKKTYLKSVWMFSTLAPTLRRWLFTQAVKAYIGKIVSEAFNIPRARQAYLLLLALPEVVQKATGIFRLCMCRVAHCWRVGRKTTLSFWAVVRPALRIVMRYKIVHQLTSICFYYRSIVLLLHQLLRTSHYIL